MKKERLTKECIEHDLKNRHNFFFYVWDHILAVLISILSPFPLCWLAKLAFPDRNPLFFYLLFSLLPFSVIGIVLYMICVYKGWFFNRYTIVTDRYMGHGSKWFPLAKKPFPCLCFSEHGKFIVTLDMRYRYYTWSEDHCMSTFQLENRSEIGDEFYLVLVNGKIKYAYNQKIFELDNVPLYTTLQYEKA